MMRRNSATAGFLIAIVLGAGVPRVGAAQTTTLRVIGPDGERIPFAWVEPQGGNASIANEKGELVLGSGRNKTYTIDVRRIGYQPWRGNLESPDTAAVLTVTLPRVSQALAPVTVNGMGGSLLETEGFYMRWLQHQNGQLRNATFIGPEMIEKRNAASVMDLLDHVRGVLLVENSKGARSATGTGSRPSGNQGSFDSPGRGGGGRSGNSMSSSLPPGINSRNVCYMTVLIDGGPACPKVGCHYTFVDDPPGSTGDEHSLDLDMLLDVKNVAAIEVYPVRDGMPPDVVKQFNGCGVILIWTGARK